MAKNLCHRITATEEGMRVWQQERIIVDITERISELMAEQRVSRKQFADRLGRSKGYVTHLLSGSGNLTIRTISDMYLALGRQFEISDAPVSVTNDYALVYKFAVIDCDDDDSENVVVSSLRVV